MKSIVIIPARLKSQRLPNKPLMKINGKSMIVQTVEKVLESGLSPVVIATDSQLIMEECSHLEGVYPVMTSESHTCGTERVLEAYDLVKEKLGAFDLIINVQGDEPFISPKLLLELQKELEERKNLADFWTTVTPISEAELDDQNVAKVVLDTYQNALIFTRDTIGNAYKHTSVYIYTPEFLEKFCNLPVSPLEVSYRLEQMRALDYGMTINCIPLDYDAISINTVEDLEKAGITNYQFFKD